MVQILMVEDDEDICEILQFYLLEQPNYSVTVVHSAEAALPLVKKRGFDIVLLDVNLPGMDGLDFCTQLRALSFCPIIFISCINDDETIISALNRGGDDYLVKPFRAPVLIARIEANLRRSRSTASEGKTLRCGALSLDTKTHRATKNGTPLSLSPTEYELLLYFMQNIGRFVSFEEIYTAVWQRPSLGDTRALFVHISHLRQKIEDQPCAPDYIKTHNRGGYIFSEPSEKVSGS